MPRLPKPWINRTKGDAWYAQINGRKVRLADAGASRKEATLALARRMAGVTDDGEGLTVESLATRFLDALAGRLARGEIAAVTAQSYDRHIADFVRVCGGMPVEKLKPAHVLAWLDSHPAWRSSIRWNAATIVKLVFNWGKRVGLLDKSPIEHMEKPRATRMPVIPTREVYERTLAASDCPEFRLFLRVLFETGCRRAEALRLEAKHIDWERSLWSHAGKTTRKTGRERVVHIPPDLLEALREQARRFPDGPLLRNTKGDPWTGDAVTSRIRDLARKLPGGLPGMSLKGLRHLFATDALERGVPIATVAELMGHVDPQMVAKTYSRLADRHDHLKEALHAVRPSVVKSVKKRRRRLK